MNAVIVTSYLAVGGLVQIALSEYKITSRKVAQSDKWKRIKKALIEAISYPYHNHF